MSGMNFTVMFIDAAVAIYHINGWAVLGRRPKVVLNLILMLVCLVNHSNENTSYCG